MRFAGLYLFNTPFPWIATQPDCKDQVVGDVKTCVLIACRLFICFIYSAVTVDCELLIRVDPP